MKNLRNVTQIAALLLCMTPFSSPAAAQNTVVAQFLPQDLSDLTSLLLTPGPITVSGTPDRYQFTFAATLRNTGTSDVYLNVGDLSFTGSGIYADLSPFADLPLSLSPQTEVTGPLFVIGEYDIVSPGTYFGSLSIRGGANFDALDPLVVQPFEIRVSGPIVPETSSFLSLGILMMLGGIGTWSIRSRRVS